MVCTQISSWSLLPASYPALPPPLRFPTLPSLSLTSAVAFGATPHLAAAITFAPTPLCHLCRCHHPSLPLPSPCRTTTAFAPAAPAPIGAALGPSGSSAGPARVAHAHRLGAQAAILDVSANPLDLVLYEGALHAVLAESARPAPILAPLPGQRLPPHPSTAHARTHRAWASRGAPNTRDAEKNTRIYICHVLLVYARFLFII